MLDRQVVKEFLDGKFKDLDLEIPEDIPKGALVDAFCQYTEDDYYKWLKDNFKSFFNHSNPDWEWIRRKLRSLESKDA